MSEQISEHPPGDIELLLPFLVNGTLDADERRMVEAAIADDPVLAHEAEVTAALRQSIRDLEDPRTPGEFGLARLMRDIGREPQGMSQDAEAETERGSQHRMPRYALAIAASCALAAVALAVLSQMPSGSGTGGPADYHQASGSAGEGSLSVAFSASATQAEVTELLLDHDLVVVDGPSALGIYRLAVSRDADPAVVAEALRQMPGVVDNVGVSE